jgi:hypothetical protein
MRLMRAAVALALMCAVPILVLAREPGWTADPRTGCTVWNWAPGADESVAWSGACQNGVAQGQGVEQWIESGKPGTRVEGVFHDGRPGAAMVVTYANGNRYEGDFPNGSRDGHGVFTWVNGDRYDGDYLHGARTGQGIYVHANGDRYEGSFRDGKMSGHGVYTWADGERYDGDYRNDRRDGHGVYTYANGNRYDGDFREGKRTGQGVFIYANGNRYEGTFRDGRMDGHGVYTFANGDRREGMWRNGTFVDGGNGRAQIGNAQSDNGLGGNGLGGVEQSGSGKSGSGHGGTVLTPLLATAPANLPARTPDSDLTPTDLTPQRTPGRAPGSALAPPPTPSAAQPPGSPQASGDRNEIRLHQDGGVLVVPVRINNSLTLDFTIDSGSADVSISSDIVKRLMRSGALRQADFLGKQTYTLADGSTVRSDTFRIRVLKVGNREIENVVGSVADEGGGLLLGQTFLSRFKSWSIDNQRQMLVLE